jgi:predicted peroxiredoxin
MDPMAKVMVQIVSGPEHATRAALGFLVAQGALDDGHDVTVFLAADGVQWVNRPLVEAIAGLGGGKLSDNLDALKNGGASFLASKMSLGARGVSEDKAAELGAEMGTPGKLVQIALESDTTLVY